ncbi:MAG: acyl carrier protein [Hyphomicrobiales bacterium]|jgi:acyl carrier protein
MTPQEIRTVFLIELSKIAPDIDPSTVSDDDHIQDDLELDSMDVLNLVTALHVRFGIDIPESDYPQIATPALAVAYLAKAGRQVGYE